MNNIIIAVIILGAIGGVFGLILSIAAKKLAVETDPRLDAILDVLPGVNCGACGFPGCAGLADAIVKGESNPSGCLVAKGNEAELIAEIMGIEATIGELRKVAQLHCNGGLANTTEIYKYHGYLNCHAAITQFAGSRSCLFGCVGLGDCSHACPFGAITMNENDLPEVDYALCTGCGICVKECPQKLFELVSIDHLTHVRCNNLDKGKLAKDQCKVACISCGICEKNCPSDAIHVLGTPTGNIARIDYDKCTNCGICVEKCPTKAIQQLSEIDPTIVFIQNEEEKTGCSGCAGCNICATEK